MIDERKINWNHKSEDLFKALGIKKKRYTKIQNKIIKEMQGNGTLTEILESVLKSNSLNDSEKLALVLSFGAVNGFLQKRVKEKEIIKKYIK